MLGTLLIRNLALIEELTVDFAGGLNIVTGETGAGKSVLIGGLQLLLGQRADSTLLRAGAEHAEVSAVLELRGHAALLRAVNAVLDGAGVAACEDGQLLLRRVLSEKGSRHYANATPVTLQVLRELGDLLVDVHGPYEHQSLLQPRKQLEVLDAFGDLAAARDDCAARHRAWQEQRVACEAAAREVPSPEQLEVLRAGAAEIDAAALQDGEDEELTQRHARAAHAQQLLELTARARERLATGEGGLLDLAAALRRELYELERLDAATGRRLAEQLDRAQAELQGLADELERYGEGLDKDPRELARLDERLTLLQRLKRKFGGSVAAIRQRRAAIGEQLGRLEHHEEYLAAQQAEAAKREAAYAEAARQLSQARREQARRLAPLVTKKLRRLGFARAEFGVALAPAPAGPTGTDQAEFSFAPNPGEGSKPLRAIASSGEISRVMLALKTVLAAADQVPVLIFDEVDANIGGEVANEVGAELARLARAHQVLCITHLPQVAAGADRHFQVSKATQGGRTFTRVTPLAEPERVRELARMLGGEKSSSVVLKHAEELVARAKRSGGRSFG